MDQRVVNDYIMYWNQASIKVLDICHEVLEVGNILDTYRLPASMFLYSTGGDAQVQLDQTEYNLKGFQLMHGGKGALLKIVTADESFKYYLIFYEGVIPTPSRPKEIDHLKRNNPFQKQYYFTPSYPIALLDKLQEMNEKWKEQEPLTNFNVKTLFYQFINQVLIELHQKEIEVKEPDLTAQVLLYIQKNYSESINLETLAETFSYSAAHLSVMFKHCTSYSPIDYLIRIRLDKAASLLAETDASIRDIATSVGYQDVYYFSRLFKKKKGVSPIEFRLAALNRKKNSDNPIIIHGNSIVNPSDPKYSDTGSDNHYQYTWEEDLFMKKMFKLPTATSFLLSLTLLLSACSGNTAGDTSTNGDAQKPETEARTKVVSTVNGDVEIPIDPKKIVTDYYPGFLLTLGIKPVGTMELYMKSPYLKEFNEGISFFEESLEAVIDLNPDLIITGNAEQYHTYAKIAPTVLIPVTLETNEKLDEFSRILDKEDEAKAWLEDYHKRVEAARKIVSGIIEEDETVTVLAGGAKDDITVYGNGYTGKSFYEGLALRQPEKVLEDIDPEKPWIQISPEVLPDYAGDYIFIAVNKDENETYDYKNEPVWKTLDAVQNDQIFEIDGWSFWFSDPISILGQIEEVTEMLVERSKNK